jgi:hypothetical protein
MLPHNNDDEPPFNHSNTPNDEQPAPSNNGVGAPSSNNNDYHSSNSSNTTNTNHASSSNNNHQPSSSSNNLQNILQCVPRMDHITHHIGNPKDVENQLYAIQIWSNEKNKHLTRTKHAWKTYKENPALLLEYHGRQVRKLIAPFQHVLQATSFKNVMYSELHLDGELQQDVRVDIYDIIADVAKQHHQHKLWHGSAKGLVAAGSTEITVSANGMVTGRQMDQSRCSQSLADFNNDQMCKATWAKVCCSEHMSTGLHKCGAIPNMLHRWRITNPNAVQGTAGEIIELEGNIFFSNPVNREEQLCACRHCGAFLFKHEETFCCNGGKNVLPDHHFDFWLQDFEAHQQAPVPADHQAYFLQCSNPTAQKHSRLCNNSLAFTMLKHDSTHGTGRELTPEYYPWMVSIQGRVYHTYLNTPQPYNNLTKPNKRLNNNIGWCIALLPTTDFGAGMFGTQTKE